MMAVDTSIGSVEMEFAVARVAVTVRLTSFWAWIMLGVVTPAAAPDNINRVEGDEDEGRERAFADAERAERVDREGCTSHGELHRGGLQPSVVPRDVKSRRAATVEFDPLRP